MSREEGVPPTRRSARTSRKLEDPTSIRAVFESRPDENLLSAQLLASLYSADQSPKEAEDRAYRVLLPIVKKQVALYKEHPHLHTGANFRIACAVCPSQQLFRGWSPLHIHADKYWKNFSHQHRGYSKALTEVLQAETIGALATAANTESVTWPPVLLVDNGGGHTTFDGRVRRWKGLQGLDVPNTLDDLELEEVLAIFRKRKGVDREVVVFPASEIGLLDVEKLTEALDSSPALAGCLKVTVSNHKQSAGNASEFSKKANTKDQAGFDYENHHPLGSWATLKEIRESGRVHSIMGKWANGFALGKDSFSTYKWPFQKSKKLRDMDVKFQESLHKYHACGAAGDENLKLQLGEIEKQLQKERLLWLKEISGVRDQFEGLQKEITNKETEKALDKRIHQMKLEKEADEKTDEEYEGLFCHRLRTGQAMHEKRQEHLHDKERKRDALLRGLRYEQNNFRKQAELAKEERDCITRSLEHEEMLDSLSRILEGCARCCNGENGKCAPHCNAAGCASKRAFSSG